VDLGRALALHLALYLQHHDFSIKRHTQAYLYAVQATTHSVVTCFLPSTTATAACNPMPCHAMPGQHPESTVLPRTSPAPSHDKSQPTDKQRLARHRDDMNPQSTSPTLDSRP